MEASVTRNKPVRRATHHETAMGTSHMLYIISMADDDISYDDAYRGIDFRKEPHRYPIGRGEQGVLIAEPYKSEILPYWKFATPQEARTSAERIFDMFLRYKNEQDFVGMDMARKFLQMGFTRARRYANHPTGTKYDADGNVKPQAADWRTSDKAESARIFYNAYLKAKQDPTYLKLKAAHQARRKDGSESWKGST